MQIETLLMSGFVLLHYNWVCLRPGILPNACHLPADFHSRCTASDFEMLTGNLLGNMEVWSCSTNRSKLVAKLLVEDSKPGRKLNNRFTMYIESDYSIVNIFHIGRLNE